MAGRGKRININADELIELCQGNLSIQEVCQKLNIHTSTLYRKAKENSQIAELLKERTEIYKSNLVEEAKRILFEMLQDKYCKDRAKLVMFVLKTKDGWIENNFKEESKEEDREIHVTITEIPSRREDSEN